MGTVGGHGNKVDITGYSGMLCLGIEYSNPSRLFNSQKCKYEQLGLLLEVESRFQAPVKEKYSPSPCFWLETVFCIDILCRSASLLLFVGALSRRGFKRLSLYTCTHQGIETGGKGENIPNSMVQGTTTTLHSLPPHTHCIE